MKTLNSLAALSALTLMLGAGCQSSQDHASNNSRKPEQAPNYTVTIESIPTSRLSPTSREGDKSGAVYSSNIIAVYVNEAGKTKSGLSDVEKTNGGGVTNAVISTIR